MRSEFCFSEVFHGMWKRVGGRFESNGVFFLGSEIWKVNDPFGLVSSILPFFSVFFSLILKPVVVSLKFLVEGLFRISLLKMICFYVEKFECVFCL